MSLVQQLVALSADAVGHQFRGGLRTGGNALPGDRVPKRATVGGGAGPADLRFWNPDRGRRTYFRAQSANLFVARLRALADTLLHRRIPEIASVCVFRALSARLAVFVEDRGFFWTVTAPEVGGEAWALLDALLSVPVVALSALGAADTIIAVPIRIVTVFRAQDTSIRLARF